MYQAGMLSPLSAVTDRSEFCTPPERILLHHPQHGNSLRGVTHDRLRELNFLECPDRDALHREYDQFAAQIATQVDTVFLADILKDDPDYRREAAQNPNLMFMRDSSITLPWQPDLFIPTRLALASRAREPAIVAKALGRLGMTPAVSFSDDEYIEGGDVLPAVDEGKRILLVGFGVRTTKAAAIKLALELIPRHVDVIIGLSHDPELLHLDTGFTILPNRVMFAAAGMFTSGFLIDENRRLSNVNPIAHAEQLGFRIVRCNKADAIAHERCNMLPLGMGRYLAFTMPDEIKAELEQLAQINISCVSGGEIAKATGGVHCLTRPLYL
jgi:N-dimethylarginine dimethylaminohydrolase